VHAHAVDGNVAISAVSQETSLILEIYIYIYIYCTIFVVVFVGVAFDKKRCKELGSAVVCVVVAAGAMAQVVFMSITVTSYDYTR
jgi:aquaporin-4